MADDPAILPAHSILPEPRLLFKGSQTDTHPLRGLSNYGPYSAGLGFPGQVRLAYLALSSYMRKLDGLVSELQNSAVPKEALNYYVDYGGFENVFHSPLITPSETLRCAMPKTCDAQAASGNGEALTESIFQAIAGLIKQ